MVWGSVFFHLPTEGTANERIEFDINRFRQVWSWEFIKKKTLTFSNSICVSYNFGESAFGCMFSREVLCSTQIVFLSLTPIPCEFYTIYIIFGLQKTWVQCKTLTAASPSCCCKPWQTLWERFGPSPGASWTAEWCKRPSQKPGCNQWFASALMSGGDRYPSHQHRRDTCKESPYLCI